MFTFGGHRHFLRFLKRTGKSKLSLQKVIKRLQKSFAPEEWYYYRKIHKKERNYFLNKGGQRGDSGGGGWVAFDTKMSKSTTSKVSSGGISSVEESKSGVVVHRKKASNSLVGVKHNTGGRRGPGKPRVRTLSNSEMSSHSDNKREESNQEQSGKCDDNMSDGDSWTVSHDMLMIDEVHTSEESENLSPLRRNQNDASE